MLRASPTTLKRKRGSLHRVQATHPPGDRYTALMRRRFGRHFATTSLLARLLDQQWLLPLAIDAARDPAVFVDVAEIGLGEGTLTPRLGRALMRSAPRVVPQVRSTWAARSGTIGA